MPPLRSRKEDILCLAQAFLSGYGEKYGLKKEFAPDALEELAAYRWPGNVRELENVIHRLYISARETVIDGMAVAMLLSESSYELDAQDLRGETAEKLDFNAIMDKQEKRLIAYALKKCGTTRAAADFLSLPQATLARKKIKHEL